MSDNPKIRRRLRCPNCGALDASKWGLRNGIQRYKCRNCQSLFSTRRKEISKSNRLIWFKKWILGKMTVEDIAEVSGYSSRQLHRWFDEYLDEYPTWHINTGTPIFLLIDGTYYSGHCLIVYRAANLKRTIYYRFTRSEDDDEIASDLMNIRSMGYDVTGITTDGGDNIIRAVEYVYPDVPRQRCLVHVQRECLSSITLHPRTPEGRMLKSLIMSLSDIRTHNDMMWWLSRYNLWVDENEDYVCEKVCLPNSTRTYFVRNDLRKAYVHLRRAIPNLFEFIKHPGLPKTTNALESFFGHVKDQLRLHRGLSETRVDNFIKWYLYFNDEKKSKK